jgi:hypothetical protein
MVRENGVVIPPWRLAVDALEHHGKRLTPFDRWIGFLLEKRLYSPPDGLPFGAFARQVEFRQHAFESIDHFGVVLKPCISATLVNKGFDLVHRVLPAVLPMSYHRWAIRIFNLQPFG